MAKKKRDDLRTFREEVGPIVRHAAVVITLMTAFVIVGLLLLLLEKLFPAHKDVIVLIEQVDLWFVVALFSVFAVFTIITVLIRLCKHVAHELRSIRSKDLDGSDNKDTK